MQKERIYEITMQLTKELDLKKTRFFKSAYKGISAMDREEFAAAELFFQQAFQIQRHPLIGELLGYARYSQPEYLNQLNGIETLGHLVQEQPNRDTFMALAVVLADFQKFHPYVALLKQIFEYEPDDDLLIRVGRIAETHGMQDLSARVIEQMEQRGLHVRLAPL